jgi:hypothetical protein
MDGGTYVIEATTNLSSWASIATNTPALQTNFPAAPTTRSRVDAGAATNANLRAYRVRLTATNSFDSTGFTP